MNRTIKLYGIIFLVVMLILALLMNAKKDTIDWRKNFDVEEKTPFGLFIFHQEAEHFFNEKLKKVHQSPYQFYQQKRKPHNILFVEHETDEESWKKLLHQVSEGSDLLFISDDYGYLRDTLEVYPNPHYSQKEEGILKLTDEQRTHKMLLDKMPSKMRFYNVPKESEILGTFQVDEEQEYADFIKIPFGKGNIYYHVEPLFLTNYYLLKNNSENYIEDVFSYLPNRETVWFLKEIDTDKLTTSGHPLGFVFDNPPLKYAWWILLAGLILLIIFTAKRTQRIIPIILPKKNKSVEFVKSIGNLYLQEGNMSDMMKKKTQYFLHHVRSDFFINTQKLDNEFIQKLHLKTGESEEKIKTLIELIHKSNDKNTIVSQEDLMNLDKIIDNILKK